MGFRGHEVDFDLKRVFSMPGIEVIHYSLYNKANRTWYSFTWISINAERRLLGMRVREILPQWIRDILKTLNLKPLIYSDATLKSNYLSIS
jgi:hypothetical protein